jgi:hypothetical protein
MEKETLLVDGLIPARTPCPFLSECPANKMCPHLGNEHRVAFSCGAARAFDLMQRTMKPNAV